MDSFTTLSRRSKLRKFAAFKDLPRCYEFPYSREIEAGSIPEVTASETLFLEIGAGKADLTMALAARNPQNLYVALDSKSDRLFAGARSALRIGLTNAVFVRCNAGRLLELLAPKSVDGLWVTFPDPFPRPKHAKHRLTHPAFLDQYEQLLKTDGKLYFKSDNLPLFMWSLEQLVASGWRIAELSFDLHQSELPAHYKHTTDFERRYMTRGLPIHMVVCTKPRR